MCFEIEVLPFPFQVLGTFILVCSVVDQIKVIYFLEARSH